MEDDGMFCTIHVFANTALAALLYGAYDSRILAWVRNGREFGDHARFVSSFTSFYTCRAILPSATSFARGLSAPASSWALL